MSSTRTRRKRSNPATKQPAREGELLAARLKLANASADLCEPAQHIVDGRLAFAPSWYDQLLDARSGKRGDSATRSSKPVTELWLDAVMLADEIHAKVNAWQPVQFVCHATCVSVTGRLDALNAKRWRPQDVKLLNDMSEQLAAWVKQISSLLTSEARLTLPNPCPECGKRIGHRIDSAGERVRCDALQVSVSGAECMACHTRWRADQLPFLGRLLSYKPLEGVIE